MTKTDRLIQLLETIIDNNIEFPSELVQQGHWIVNIPTMNVATFIQVRIETTLTGGSINFEINGGYRLKSIPFSWTIPS